MNNYSKFNFTESRHYSPANREWNNSVYSYNKNTSKEVVIKDKILNKLISSYFYLSVSNTNSKSRRMRNLIKRSSTKKIFVSKPEIKQTNDKYIVTIYLYDRNNHFLKRKLYFTNKLLNNNNFYFKEQNVINDEFSNLKSLNKHKYIYDLGVKNLLVTKSKKKRLRIKHRLLVKNINNYKVRYNIIPKNILPFFLTSRIMLKETFTFLFLKTLMGYIGVKFEKKLLCLNCKHESTITSKNEFSQKEICSQCLKKIKTKWNKINLYKKNIKIYGICINDLNKLAILNNVMKNLLYKHFNIIMFNYNIRNKLIKLFNNFRKSEYKRFINHFFIKEFKLLRQLNLLRFNKFKLNNFIPYLKELANNIYNKTSEFNIINLKYLHLNASNLLEALSIKLKKRKSRLIQLLGKTLKLVKIPKKLSVLSNDNDISFGETSNTEYKILKSIRYKWITGIRLEAKGRLTKRFTASRALFKYVNKGNLKNMEYLYQPRYKSAESIKSSVNVLRGQFRPNLQHAYIYSNKRIGTFGLKGWISSI